MGFKEINAAIREHDAHWISKLVLRAILTVINLTIVGLAAWEISAILRRPSSGYSYADDELIENGAPWFFIPVGLSLLWTFVSVPILFGRRKPAHPGFYVSFDLILFLIYAILGGLFVAVASYQLQDVDASIAGANEEYGAFTFSYYSRDSQEGYPSSRNAVLNDRPYTYHSYNGGPDVLRQPNSPNYLCPYFDSCANQANFFTQQRVRAQVTLAAASLLLVGQAIHLALFIWACIDCARYNQKRADDREYSRARMMANRMVMDMQRYGQAPAVPFYVPLEKHADQFAPAPVAMPAPAAFPKYHQAPVSGPTTPSQHAQPQMSSSGNTANYDFYAADRGTAYQPSPNAPSSPAVAGPAPKDIAPAIPAAAATSLDKGKGKDSTGSSA